MASFGIDYASAENGIAFDVVSYHRTPHGSDPADPANPYVVKSDNVQIVDGFLTVRGGDSNWSVAGAHYGSFGPETGGWWNFTRACISVELVIQSGALDDVGTGPLITIHKDELHPAPYPFRLALIEGSGDEWELNLLAQAWDADIDTSVIFNRNEIEGQRVRVRAEWQCGTPTLSSPGFSDVAPDGFVRIYWNGVLVINVTNSDFYISDDQDEPNWGNGFSLGHSGLMGKVANWRVRDSLCTTRHYLLVGDDNHCTGENLHVHGAHGTLDADNSVHFNLDGVARTRTISGAFDLWGRFFFNGTEFTSQALAAASGSVSALDVSRLALSLQGLGVYSGCAVTEGGGSPSMDVDVAAGHIRTATGVGVLVTAGSVTLDTADATNPRLDIVWVNSSGTLGRTTGTPAAEPVPPSIPANSVVLALVSVPANDVTISNSQITDKRTFTRLSQFARKTSDESVANTTLQNDDDLKFTMGASEVWIADLILLPEGTTTGDIKINLDIPAGATYRLGGVGTIVTAAGNDGDGRFITTAGSGFDLTYGMIGAGNRVPIFLKALVVNSTTPGTVTVKWAENSSDVTATKMQAFSALKADMAA